VFLDVSKLVCYGCAHSAGSAPFPSHPSGERPCCFCIRNPKREEQAKNAMENQPGLKDASHNPWAGKWYDGSDAVSVPMDCYHTVDMKMQFSRWMKEDV
jgi:hypothetical protein